MGSRGIYIAISIEKRAPFVSILWPTRWQIGSSGRKKSREAILGRDESADKLATKRSFSAGRHQLSSPTSSRRIAALLLPFGQPSGYRGLINDPCHGVSEFVGEFWSANRSSFTSWRPFADTGAISGRLYWLRTCTRGEGWEWLRIDSMSSIGIGSIPDRDDLYDLWMLTGQGRVLLLNLVIALCGVAKSFRLIS